MFFPSYINDFNSMKDGEHYTMLEKKEKHQEIVKYKFKNGKKSKFCLTVVSLIFLKSIITLLAIMKTIIN